MAALNLTEEDRWSIAINGILSVLPKSRFIKELRSRTYIRSSWVSGPPMPVEIKHLIIDFEAKGYTSRTAQQTFSMPLNFLEDHSLYFTDRLLQYVCDKLGKVITEQAIPHLESILALEGEPGQSDNRDFPELEARLSEALREGDYDLARVIQYQLDYERRREEQDGRLRSATQKAHEAFTRARWSFDP